MEKIADSVFNLLLWTPERVCSKTLFRDFPGGPVVKSLHSQCRGHEFNPGWGTKIPHATPRGQKNNNKTLFSIFYLSWYLRGTVFHHAVMGRPRLWLRARLRKATWRLMLGGNFQISQKKCSETQQTVWFVHLWDLNSFRIVAFCPLYYMSALPTNNFWFYLNVTLKKKKDY